VLQAWVQWINDKGGINCHPIGVFVGDDGGDPSTHQSLVQRFVQQDGVVAFVFMNAPFAGEAGVKYLRAKGIPVFGSEGGSEWFNQNPNYFPQMSTGRQIVEGPFAMAGQLDVPKGLTKLASLTCVEAPICSAAYGYAGELAQKYGMQLVYRGQISMTEPNFTSACLQAKNAGAQILFSGVDGSSDQRIARSCLSVGFQPKIVTMAVGLTLAQAAAPILSGIQVSIPVTPWFSTGIKAVAEYSAALAKYAAGREPDAVGMQAWAAAQMFAYAVERAGDDITSASITRGAYQIKNNTFGGLTQPLTFKQGAANNMQRMCWWAAEFNGERVTSPNGGRMTCG
jgi:ABC-type branched-subunit amino acid transport system substrate-binding protein